MGVESKKFLTYAEDASKSVSSLFEKGRLFAADLDNNVITFDKASCRKRRFLEKALSRLTRFAERILARCTKMTAYFDSLISRYNITKASETNNITMPSPSKSPYDESNDISPSSTFKSGPCFAEDSDPICDLSPERVAHSYIPDLFPHSKEDLRRILPDESAFNSLSALVSRARLEESFGASLARLREKQGLKISDFSGLTLLSSAQYHKYRNDEDTPHRFKLQRIITGMGLSLSDARDLWQKAGYNEYKPEDRLFFACLKYGIYDLDDINTISYFFFRDYSKLIPIPAEKE